MARLEPVRRDVESGGRGALGRRVGVDTHPSAAREPLEALRIDPAYTTDGAARLFLPLKLPKTPGTCSTALRKAGIPEK